MNRNAIFLTAFALSFAAQAGTISVSNPTLGVDILLKDSRIGTPIDSITDSGGTDFTTLKRKINKQIADRTIHCYEGDFNAWLYSIFYPGCDWKGLLPTAAKILPYSSFIDGYPDGELALVFKGKLSKFGERTYFIPIQYLVERVRAKESVPWWWSDGGIRSSDDPGFDHIDVSQIFDEEPPTLDN